MQNCKTVHLAFELSRNWPLVPRVEERTQPEQANQHVWGDVSFCEVKKK